MTENQQQRKMLAEARGKEVGYILVEDVRTNKLYLDFADSMIRNFERVLHESASKTFLLSLYPKARDLTLTTSVERSKP